MKDKGFSLPCEKACRARLCAERLLEWMYDNKETTASFFLTLVTDIVLLQPPTSSYTSYT